MASPPHRVVDQHRVVDPDRVGNADRVGYPVRVKDSDRVGDQIGSVIPTRSMIHTGWIQTGLWTTLSVTRKGQ